MAAARPGNRRNDGIDTRARVLVIEDDDDLCALPREALTADGYAVATGRHGAAALDLVKQHPAAVILVDLRMPIMDGWSFIEHYRRTASPPASIIVLSAMPDGQAMATRLNVHAWIGKPFQLEEVSRTVRTCIAST